MKREWSEKQVDTLKQNYANGKKEDLIKLIGKSWCAILCKANKLKLQRELLQLKNVDTSNWSLKELEILKKNYFELSKEELIKLIPNRKWSSIQQKAFCFNLKRKTERDSELSVLLKENNEVYYWLGFLMADGHFSESSIQVNLAKKDIEHLKKFSKFVKCKKDLVKPNFKAGDKKVLNLLRQKFKIKNNKTYHPCDIENIKNDDFLFSLIIGFIDGDGSICASYGRTSLSVKCHSSWFNNLEIMLNVLCGENKKTYKTRINSYNLAYFFITDLSILKKIKLKLLGLKLPVLKRKWDKIDLKKESAIEEHERLKKMCYDNFKLGKKPSEITDKNRVSVSFCYKMLAEYRKIETF